MPTAAKITAMKGHDFSRASMGFKPIQAGENKNAGVPPVSILRPGSPRTTTRPFIAIFAPAVCADFLKGTGFSPYIKPAKKSRALAPEARLFLAALLFAAPLHAELPIASTPAPTPPNQPREASLDDYRQHLQSLSTLTEACAKARDTKACDPALIGPDDSVAVTAPGKLVRYDWLRALFLKAQTPDEAPPATKTAAKPTSNPPPPAKAAPKPSEEDSVRPPKPTTSALLTAAQTRLAQDLAQTNAAPQPLPAHTQERATMKQVLAGREFRNLEEPTARDSMLEKVGDWLNKILAAVGKIGVHGAWIGRLLTWGFVLAVCVALVWALLRIERRWRVRLTPEDSPPAPGAASAIPWQDWLDDAHRSAAKGDWREAIHFVYWASISRLESKRLWPADRARTPREYLALVAVDDPRKPGLAALTGSFERYWYGGRAASQGEYEGAEELATALIGAGASPNVSTKPGAGGKP